MEEHIFNLSIWEAKAGEALNSGISWSTKYVLGYPGLYRKTVLKDKKQKQQQEKCAKTMKAISFTTATTK